MYDLTLGASNPIPFVMVDASGIEVAGLSTAFTVTLRKDGGSFGASAGAKAELGGGWYLYTATAGECDTDGPLALRITGAGVMQQNLVYRVIGEIATNLTQMNGDTDPVDNLVLSLGSGGIVENLNSMLEAAGQDYRFTAAALAQGPTGSNLTAQQMRDAMLLAPSSGTPAAGSIDKHIDDLLADTTAIRVITDAIDVSAVTVTTSNNAGELTIKRSASFSATVSGLSIPADWLAVIWTLKGAASDDDDDAVIQVRVSNPAAETDGLQRIEGGLPAGLSLTAEAGLVTVSQPGGTAVLALKAAASAVMEARGDAVWDLRVLRPPIGEADELTTGTADIVYTVTHARDEDL